ncbi:hypothetical protein WA1_01360 [Scytonema hofmannii PCC 7110]|uniref:Uncharacterized protein n=1 Tax=Scytonema hofmannii PCC 7110 TaxID=128403 RepID=A0A139XGP7_9CYAN|nr:hypothetical protein [Scytonema hofmannii]KYC43833.1 hypothetical protein WA1_01360 [Scytonema hofmannii PCC 7110]
MENTEPKKITENQVPIDTYDETKPLEEDNSKSQATVTPPKKEKVESDRTDDSPSRSIRGVSSRSPGKDRDF